MSRWVDRNRARDAAFALAGALALAGCSTGAEAPAASTPMREATSPTEPGPVRPPFSADLGLPAPDAGAPADPPVDPALHARLLRELFAVTVDATEDHDWEALLYARAAYGGNKVWVPGTGEHVADDESGRAMTWVPHGLEAYGPAIRMEDWTPALGGALWLGALTAQAAGGAEFSKLERLAAFTLFGTALSDALAIVGALGPRLTGAWLVGHSAGALPAILAGLLGGAHRVDAYGVPSVVGPLDGDDGIVHLHTHPLDPAGSMGWIDADGRAQVDYASAFVVTVKAGLSLQYHDYGAWPAPAP